MPGLRERIAEALEDAIWPKDKPHESLLTELREKCYLPWADAVISWASDPNADPGAAADAALAAHRERENQTNDGGTYV